MDLSLVIPTHNRHENVLLLLDSIREQDLGATVIEVIVVSNLKDQVLEKKLKAHKVPTSLYSTGKIGVNAARNLGVQKAQSKNIYFLDDDVLLKNPKHLQHLLAVSKEHQSMAAIGGSYLLSKKAGLVDEIYHQISTAWMNKKSTYLLGGNTLYHLDSIRIPFHFNEGIIFGGSETELNLRLHNSGHEFLFLESLNIEHDTHLNAFSLSKKALRQGMGRSFHESIVPKSFWSVDTNSSQDILSRYQHSKILYYSALCHLALYEFFFHVGYRHGKKENNGPLSLNVVFTSMLETFFQVDSDKILYVPNPDATPFHQKAFPSLKFKEFHHWTKANIWWKIPNFIFWKAVPPLVTVFVCALWTLIPFNTIGLRVPYDRAINRFERLFKKET